MSIPSGAIPSPLKPAASATTTSPEDETVTVLPPAMLVVVDSVVDSGDMVASGVLIAISVIDIVGTIATSVAASVIAIAAIVASAVASADGGINTASMTWITPFDA